MKLPAAALLILGLCTGEAAIAEEASANCPILVTAPERLGETLLCDTILVPQDWDDPDGTQIPITYVVLKSTSLAPQPDPVIYFQGGPGGSALNSLSLISSGTEALRASRDIILFDQRGTAHSSELYCPQDLMVVSLDTLDEDTEAAQVRLDALNIGAFSDPAEVYDAVVQASAMYDRSRCLKAFAERGIELEHYNTASTVRDTIAVMAHLGYDAYNLYGGSYGTTVVLRTLDHYEQSPDVDLPEIRTAVLDSVAPPHLPFFEQGYLIAYVALGIFDACEADPVCSPAYPDIRNRAVKLLEDLVAQPIVRQGMDDITGAALAEVLRTGVTSQPTLVPYLPRLVADLKAGETGLFDLAMAVVRGEAALPTEAPEAPEAAPMSVFEETQQSVDAISAQLDEVRDAVELLGAANAILREAALNANGRADFVIRFFETYARLGGMTGNTLFERLQPFVLHPEQRTRDGLGTLVQQTVFLPSLQSEVLAIIERLSEEDIDTIFTRLVSPAFDIGLAGIDSITNRTVFCNDYGPTMFNDAAFEAYRTFEAPQLIGASAQWVANYQISCVELGLAVDTYAPSPPPVESNVRTLILAGSLDTATPALHAHRTAEHLSAAQVIELPMQGHVAGLTTDCGRALVHAFILSPDVEPNRNCVSALRPPFVLPTDDLPEGP